MKIQFIENDDIAKELEINDSLIRIGSHESCNLCLPDLRLLPQHIMLFKQSGGTWMLEATSAGATTYHNGKHVEGSTPLRNGDELMVLEYRLRLLVPREETAAPETPKLQPAVSEEITRIRQHPLPAGAVVRKPDEDCVLSAQQRQMLVSFAMTLRTCDTMPKLMDVALDTLLNSFQARMAWFGVRKSDHGRLDHVEGRLHTRKGCGDPALLETIAYRCLERGQLLCVPTPDDPDSRSFLAMPLVSSKGRNGLIYAESKVDSPSYNQGHLSLLASLAPFLAAQLEVVFNEQSRLQDAVSTGEQSFLRLVQSRLDLVSVPQWEGYQFAAYCKSGLDRVGDVYDIMRLPNGMMALMLGNITGEASRVGMAMVEVRTAFRVAGLHADPPHTLLKVFEWLIHDQRQRCAMSVAAGIVNPKTGVFQYTTAGSIGLACVDTSGEPRRLVDPAVPPCGTVKGYAYNSKIGQLKPEESLAFYSPGVAKVTDGGGVPLGEDRFFSGLADCFGQSAAAAIEEVTSEFAGYFKKGRNSDDITLLVLRRTE